MAVSKVLNGASLSIEVENGTDKLGNPVYKKKNFSGVKITATPENIFAVATSIAGVLSNTTRDSFINETSKLVNN